MDAPPPGCREEGDCLRGQTCVKGECVDVEECFCPLVLDPVCGADGNQYNNACEAGCAGVAVAEGDLACLNCPDANQVCDAVCANEPRPPSPLGCPEVRCDCQPADPQVICNETCDDLANDALQACELLGGAEIGVDANCLLEVAQLRRLCQADCRTNNDPNGCLSDAFLCQIECASGQGVAQGPACVEPQCMCR